jgi:type IV secretion system protein VirB2
MNQLAKRLRSIDSKALSFLVLMLLSVCYAPPVYAQGLDKVNTLMDLILEALNAVSIGAVTIAVILTGYKMAFKGDSLGDCAPVIVGGVIIGAAGQIARMLVG